MGVVKCQLLFRSDSVRPYATHLFDRRVGLVGVVLRVAGDCKKSAEPARRRRRTEEAKKRADGRETRRRRENVAAGVRDAKTVALTYRNESANVCGIDAPAAARTWASQRGPTGLDSRQE